MDRFTETWRGLKINYRKMPGGIWQFVILSSLFQLDCSLTESRRIAHDCVEKMIKKGKFVPKVLSDGTYEETSK